MAGPVVDDRADDLVGLRGVPVEQGAEGGQQADEQRGGLAPGQRVQSGHQCGRKLGDAGLLGPLVRGRDSGRKHEPVGRVGEMPPPEGELTLCLRRAQELALPGRVVGVLHRQVAELMRLVPCEREIERDQFVMQDAQRPGVADEVVHDQDQDVIIGGQPHQARPEQRPFLVIEGAPRLVANPLLQFLVRSRGCGEIRPFDADRCFGVYELHQVLTVEPDRGPQRLMAALQFQQAALERGQVEPTVEPVADLDVVGAGGLAFELLQEPLSLLRKRCRGSEQLGVFRLAHVGVPSSRRRTRARATGLISGAGAA